MYLLYLDDSGSIENQNEEYFVLGGVCVPENSVRWLAHKLEEYAEQIEASNPRLVEFHASEIYAGRNFPWDRFRSEERKQVIKNVLGSLRDAYPDIVVFACAIHKASFPSQDPVEMAFEDLSSRFNMYLQRVSTADYRQRGIIVLDKSSYEIQLQNQAVNFRAEGNQWGSYLRQICEVPLFVDSKASRIIQLADHIAYAVFRRYNAGDLNYFGCIEGRFDTSDGIMHGLRHLQTNNPSCTCPSCITRHLSSPIRDRSR